MTEHEPVDLAKLTRKQLEAVAEEEGVREPSNRYRFPSRVALAEEITRVRADHTEPDVPKAFKPVTFWAVGPAPFFPNPRVHHPDIGHEPVKPVRGAYVAQTPRQVEVLERTLRNVAYREDLPEPIECGACGYAPRSSKAFQRHFRECHPDMTLLSQQS